MAVTRKFSDLNFSFIMHPVTGDIGLTFNDQDIRATLKNLILTKNYERPFQPDLGCNVSSLLFENASPITAILIKKSIEQVVANYEPRVSIVDVQVYVADPYSYQVAIFFTILNNPQPVTLNLILKTIR